MLGLDGRREIALNIGLKTQKENVLHSVVNTHNRTNPKPNSNNIAIISTSLLQVLAMTVI